MPEQITIISFGENADYIADHLSQYDAYTAQKASEFLPEQSSRESYENNMPDNLASVFFEASEEILAIVEGFEPISGAVLGVLQWIRDRAITILYIRPDHSLMIEQDAEEENFVYGVLQQYTRSGNFEKMYIFELARVEDMLETQVVNLQHKALESIAENMHLINVFERRKAVLESPYKPKDTARLVTLGKINYETGKMEVFCDLKMPNQKRFYYLINKEEMSTNKKLKKKIIEQVKQHKEDGCSVSYKICETNYPANYVWCEIGSGLIQS